MDTGNSFQISIFGCQQYALSITKKRPECISFSIFNSVNKGKVRDLRVRESDLQSVAFEPILHIQGIFLGSLGQFVQKTQSCPTKIIRIFKRKHIRYRKSCYKLGQFFLLRIKKAGWFTL